MKKILIVCANYYPKYMFSLKSRAEFLLKKNKIKTKHIYVPGIFEIPVVIARNIKKFDGFVALGCVIKGETPHFEYISKATFNALMYLAIQNKKPIGNGIITALKKSQDLKYGISNLSKSKGKGFEAAMAAIEVFKNVPKS